MGTSMFACLDSLLVSFLLGCVFCTCTVFLFARSLHSKSDSSRIDSSNANSNSDGGSMDTVATPIAAVQAPDVCVFS